jgi:hypothetical protein
MDAAHDLSATVNAALVYQRLRGLRDASLLAATLPGAVLMLESRWPLPAALTWLVTVAWAWAAGLALVAEGGLQAWRGRFDIRRARCETVAHLSLEPGAPLPALAATLDAASTALGGVFWMNVVAPGLVEPRFLTLSGCAWVLTVGARIFFTRSLHEGRDC